MEFSIVMLLNLAVASKNIPDQILAPLLSPDWWNNSKLASPSHKEYILKSYHVIPSAQRCPMFPSRKGQILQLRPDPSAPLVSSTPNIS